MNSPRCLMSLAVFVLATPACHRRSDEALESESSGDDLSSEDLSEEGSEDEGVQRLNPDWTEHSHSNDVEPNYAVVFPGDSVRRIDLTISEEQWAAMQADLTVLQSSDLGAAEESTDDTPMWAEGTIESEGITWQHVGVRYKGNSSLRDAFEHEGDKYPFKLDFDEWEDVYPDTDDQRFYGFKQLNLGSNFGDASSMREKVAADLFREFGVPAAKTAFCEVYLDKGDGPTRLGLYTLIEELDDTLPSSQFPDDSGNLYKPDGLAATLAADTYSPDDYFLKTNEEEADYSDIAAFFEVLHADSRISDQGAWANALEATFNIDRYLRYLAAHLTIQNWDSYGTMSHNYFLYNDEGRLTWIPWDNNEALQSGKQDGALSLGLEEVGEEWPMLRFIIDVPEYEMTYRLYLEEFVDSVFLASRMDELYSTYAELLSESVDDAPSFESAVSDLKAHAQSRGAAVRDFVSLP